MEEHDSLFYFTLILEQCTVPCCSFLTVVMSADADFDMVVFDGPKVKTIKAILNNGTSQLCANQ